MCSPWTLESGAVPEGLQGFVLGADGFGSSTAHFPPCAWGRGVGLLQGRSEFGAGHEVEQCG